MTGARLKVDMRPKVLAQAKYTILIIGILIVSLVGVWYYITLPPSFEEELEYYREWTKTNPSGAGSGEWIFRNIREEPHRIPTTVLLESWEEYKAWYENLEDTEAHLHEVRKLTYKGLREIVSTWKAVYIDYDPESKVIWSYALEFGPQFGLEEGVECWVLCYWKAR